MSGLRGFQGRSYVPELVRVRADKASVMECDIELLWAGCESKDIVIKRVVDFSAGRVFEMNFPSSVSNGVCFAIATHDARAILVKSSFFAEEERLVNRRRRTEFPNIQNSVSTVMGLLEPKVEWVTHFGLVSVYALRCSTGANERLALVASNVDGKCFSLSYDSFAQSKALSHIPVKTVSGLYW